MVITYNLTEIDSVAEKILAHTKSKILLFYGEMGAGKTTLIKALVKALGADDSASSPTFSLVNEYHSSQGKIYHFDFYRIENSIEALDIGFEEYMDSNGWIFIEWPQKIIKFLREKVEKVQISVLSEGERKLKLC